MVWILQKHTPVVGFAWKLFRRCWN